MESTTEKVLVITLKGEEIVNLKNIITKCKKENKAIGFKRNRFNVDENKLLKELDGIV